MNNSKLEIENTLAMKTKRFLNDKAKLVVSRLEPSLADDYKSLKEAILREFKQRPLIC